MDSSHNFICDINKNPLFSIYKGTTFIKNISNINFYCPKEKPVLCSINSNSFGLCKNTINDCDNLEGGVIPIIPNNNSINGEKYGYVTNNLHVRCNELKLEYSEKFIGGKLPDNIKIITYNIWGLCIEQNDKDFMNFKKELIITRMKQVVKEIKKYQPDIICFQEMSDLSLSLLKSLYNDYPYRYETNFNQELIRKQRLHEVEVYVFSKYPAQQVKLYSIRGNLNYTDSFMIIEFKDVNIYNCYLQAGSKKSPGQENYWTHYSRCRKDQILEIKKLILQDKKSVILVGDFNCHLDGGEYDWTEVKELTYFNDSFREINPYESGYTEDTDINLMRWNTKFIKKQVRYDGILYKGTNLNPLNSIVIGKTPIIISSELSNKFINYIVSPDDKKLIKYYNNNFVLFPSDHFGVMTTFNIKH